MNTHAEETWNVRFSGRVQVATADEARKVQERLRAVFDEAFDDDDFEFDFAFLEVYAVGSLQDHTVIDGDPVT